MINAEWLWSIECTGYRVNVMESGYSAQLLDVYRRGPGYRDELLDIVN